VIGDVLRGSHFFRMNRVFVGKSDENEMAMLSCVSNR
jgi:hypothetical protein